MVVVNRQDSRRTSGRCSRVAYSYTDNGRKTRTTWARGVWRQHAYNVRNLVSGTPCSGTEQGAGGVEGQLAVSMGGVFYIPCYDHNGNIIESSGPFADVFSFGFSTQYHDRETGMVGYQQRFLLSSFWRWLNRDPIEEDGGVNF